MKDLPVSSTRSQRMATGAAYTKLPYHLTLSYVGHDLSFYVQDEAKKQSPFSLQPQRQKQLS